MTVIDRLSYVIEADTTKFRDGVTATRRELRAIGEIAASTRTPMEKYSQAVRNLDTLLAKGGITVQQHARALRQLQDEYDETNKAASRWGDTLGKLKDFAGVGLAAAGVTAGGGLVAAGIARGVSLASEAEQSQVAFKVMLRDAGRAKDLVREIRAFAAATPMQFGELRDATRMLIAFGESDKTVLDTLRRLGDVASGTGQAIGEVAEIYGKMRVQGRAFAEDINQFQGRGIPIVQELAKVLGVSQGEIRGMVTAGTIGFAEIEKAIASMTDAGGRFGGMMAEQSQTLAGQWSTFKDELDDTFRSIAEEFVPSLKLALPLLREMAALAKDIGVPLARAGIGLADTIVRPGAAGAKVELQGVMERIGDLETKRTDIALASRGRSRTRSEIDAMSSMGLELNRLRERRDFLQATIDGRDWARAAVDLEPIVEASIKGFVNAGLGDRTGDLGSAGLKGGDLAYRKADQIANRNHRTVLGALGGLGATFGGSLLGGVAAAGEGLGVGVRNAGLIAQMRSLLIDNGPVTVGAAAKLKGSQEAFSADQARKVGREQDEAMRVRKEQLKALIEIANKLGVAVPTDITGVL